MARQRCIASAISNPPTFDLFLTFTQNRKALAPLSPDGRPYSYTYHAVPAAVFAQFQVEGNSGIFYNFQIRSTYAFTRTD